MILSSIFFLPFIFDSYQKAQTIETLLKDTGNALKNTSTVLSEYLIFSNPRAKKQLVLAAEHEDFYLDKLENFSKDYPLITRLIQKHKDFHINLEMLFKSLDPVKSNTISPENKKLIIMEIGSQLFLFSSEISGYVMELTSLTRKDFIAKSNFLFSSIFIYILILSMFLLFIVFWMQKRLVSPLLELRDSVEGFSQGDFTIKIKINRSDEIGNLADSFSRMQKSIQKHVIKITEARENLHITLNSIGDGVIVTDMRGTIIRMNPIAENLTGWKLQKAEGKSISDIFNIVHTQTGEPADNPVEKVLATGDIVSLANHTSLIAKNGTKYHIADSGAPIKDADKNITGVVLVFRDVTKEYQLREQYRTLFEKTNDAIFIVEKSTGRYLDVNAAAAQLTGRTLGELKQLTTCDVSQDGADARLFDITDLDQAKELGTITYCQPDKTRRIARLSTVPLNDNAVICIARDITHDLKVEKQLRQSQKMEAIGTLAGGIAHDFNNILSGIFGFAHLAKMGLDNPEKTKKNIDQIVKGAQRAADLVQQILTFSRQKEQQKIQLKLYLVVKEAIKFLRSSIPSTIEIRENILSRETVLADPTQAHQVVMNLCTNAFQSMHGSEGTLTVELTDVDVLPQEIALGDVHVPGRYIKLEVRDTGHGMDRETLEKIFEPYFTTKQINKGTGLGLAVVDGIIKKHNGFVKIFSKVGHGSSFQVFWPIVKKKSGNSFSEEKKTGLPKGTEHIMLVDDEADVRDATQAILEQQGYKVTIFKDGHSAMTTFRENIDFFDLVITDFTMPQMTGYELSTQILKLKKDMPIILCTGFSEDISEEKTTAIGIKSFLLKPVVMKELLQKIRQLLDN